MLLWFVSRIGLRTSGSPGGNDSSVQARISDEVDLDSGVPSGVINRAGVDICDGHFVRDILGKEWVVST